MRVVFIMLMMACLSACNSKVQHKQFSAPQFETALKDCLNEKAFRKMGSLDTGTILTYVIKTNYKIRDTLLWEEKLFKINPLDTNDKHEQLITVQFSYPSENECLLMMRYTPDHSFSLVQERTLNPQRSYGNLIV